VIDSTKAMSDQNNPQANQPADNAATASGTTTGADLAAGMAADLHAAANATEASAEAPPVTIESLQAELAAAQDELKDTFLRAKADVENARRRADEDVQKARKFAVEGFAESLLPVIDSFDAALSIETATIEQMREGIEATNKQLVSALERNKVIAIAPAPGTKFDPHQHQAISVVPAQQEPNTVVNVLQKGYLIAERVMRPALVTVTAPK
jgi:molecular chaperone GrpE